ncbi:FMN-dependent dehydrogenase [Mycena olivaceomarginata]|nr:FMN-dependent dehydrogenase [Mycena olivaceomarginata]
MASSPSDPLNYEQSVFQAGLHSARPPFTTHSPLRRGGYIHGNAGAGSTYAKNLAAFHHYSIVPRRNVPSRTDKDGNLLFSDTTTTILGQALRFPIAMAPIGVQKIFNEAGEVASAKAAASVGVPYILSTASSTSMEDVAAANGDGQRWYQLYFRAASTTRSRFRCSIARRRRGIQRSFVTLDTFVLGWRPSDMDNGYNPFIVTPDRIGVEIGFTDPVFRAHFKQKHGYEVDETQGTSATALSGIGAAAQAWTKIVFPGHPHSWADIAFLQEHWNGPIVLKGIQSVADARAALKAGVQGIVVSNHGGRQHDGGASTLGTLPRIVEAVGSEMDVLFDSGVRCGADVVKALALGAKCVLIGRPYAYGLALGGGDGVRHVLRAICGDLIMNMHLSGMTCIEEVNRDILVKEDDLF